jgi:Protein of unknown function (DUF2971)
MENGYRTGTDVVAGRLYHYEKFRPQWLEATLRDKRIHCSDPAKLNDPWDCRVSFDYTPMLRDPPEREKMLAVHRRALPPETLNHPLRPVYEDLIRNSDEELIKAVNESSRLLTEQLQLRRIYCLTPDPLSTLMWSHYGGDHTGICLEFHVGNRLFLTAHGVKYEKQYPRFVLSQMNSPDALKCILTKAKCWEYEQEYRLIGSPRFPEGAPLKLDGNFLKLPDRALPSVIVGCNGDFGAVKRIVNAAAPEVRVIQIRRAPNQYNLMMAIP